VQLGVGIGIGHRDVLVPSREGDRALESGVFPALGIRLEGGGPVGARGLFAIRFHYQTSLGLKASESPAAGSGKETPLRAHHVQVGVVPGLRLGGAAHPVSLHLFAGWGLRGLRAITEIGIPQYMLHGPVVRPELHVPFSEAAELRVAPEVQAIIGISDDLRQLADTASTGLAWGGEISLSVALAQSLRLHLDYRESHARIGSAWGNALTDTERFATVGMDLCY